MEKKKYLSVVVAILLLIGMIPADISFAEESQEGVAIVAGREGNLITVALVTNETLEPGGFELNIEYDHDILAYSSYSTQFNNPYYNSEYYKRVKNTDFISNSTGRKITVNAGSPLLTVNFEAKNGFEYDTEYIFRYWFEMAFDYEQSTVYDWSEADITTTYAEYTVKFEAPDADAPVDATQYVVRGQSATAPDDPQRTGFEFDGWEVSKGNAASVTDAIMEPTTFTAKWKKAAARTATVTWVDGNGKTLKTDTVEHGVIPVYDGDTPTKTDPASQYTYRFNGNWDPAVAPVTGDVTYTAQFDQVQTRYRIYVKDYTNGGAVTSLDPNAYYSGTVDFTVDAGQATVLAQVVDGTAETVNSTDGTYERLYGTETDGSHHFSVTMPGDRDLYLIMGYKGDCDYNGEVDLKDATNISQIYVETQTANALQRLLGDADGNGELTLKDSTRIAWHYTDHEPLKWDQRES